MIFITKKKKGIFFSIIIVFIINLFLLKDYLPEKFIINFSYSMPVGIYIISNDINYEVGDIVAIVPPNDVKKLMISRGYLKENQYLLKEIKGLEGQKYHTINDLAYVDDKYIGQIFKVDSQNRPLPRFLGEHTIPKGYFLPIADNRPNSYDGRYFGFLKIEDIKYKLYPLITFK